MTQPISLRDARMLRLVRSFHTMARYPHSRWDPLQFQKWAKRTQGSGGRHAAQFVLAVWNSSHRWSIGPFRAIDAMATWDSQMREAFVAWAKNPWWA